MNFLKIGISRLTFMYVFLAVLVGLIVGAIDALFGRGLILITSFRQSHAPYLLPLLALAGLVIIFLYQKLGKESSKGMGLIFEAGNHARESIPKRLIPLGMFSTWLSHLFGASVGREGFAVQIGGTIGHWFGQKLSSHDSQKILLITGMAAGFSGLFQTPLAATFFAIEILMLGKIEYMALFPAMIAAFVASTTSHWLGLEKFTYNLHPHLQWTPLNFIKIVVVALCFGLVGRAFALGLHYLKGKIQAMLPNPYLRIALLGLLLSVALITFYQGRYAGLGTNLISEVFGSGTIYSYDWLMKLLLTILSLAAGFQGGEVTPLFTIGATLGVTLGGFLGLPIPLMAAAGYVAVFASATNAYFAPLFIGAEVFGYASLPYLLPIVTIAYLLNGNSSIYAQEKLDENL